MKLYMVCGHFIATNMYHAAIIVVILAAAISLELHLYFNAITKALKN